MIKFSFAFLLIVLAVSCIEASLPRGVSPQNAEVYVASSSLGKFSCDSGATVIQFSAVNDDYCDCADGTDEPGTSACASINGAKETFYCANVGHEPRLIYASLVDDGFCDCCDGSDELATDAQCPNTCFEEGIERRKHLEEQVKLHRAGAQIKHAWQERANVAIAERSESVDALRKQLQALMRDIELVELDINELKETIGEEDDEVEFEQKQDDEQVNDEVTQDIYDRIDDDSDEEAKPVRVPIIGDVVKKSDDDDDDDEARQALEALKTELATLRQEADALEKQVSEADVFLAFDFGPGHAYYALYGQQYVLDNKGYRYRIEPFVKAAQDSTSIGTFSQWTDDGKMLFDNGQRCWNGPNRSCSIEFQCALENELVSAEETSKCVYALVMNTFAACSLDLANQLQQQLDTELQSIHSSNEINL